MCVCVCLTTLPRLWLLDVNQQVSPTPKVLLRCSWLHFPSQLPVPLDLGIGELCLEGPSSAPDTCSALLWLLL